MLIHRKYEVMEILKYIPAILGAGVAEWWACGGPWLSHPCHLHQQNSCLGQGSSLKLCCRYIPCTRKRTLSSRGDMLSTSTVSTWSHASLWRQSTVWDSVVRCGRMAQRTAVHASDETRMANDHRTDTIVVHGNSPHAYHRKEIPLR